MIIRDFQKADQSALRDLIFKTIEISYQDHYPPLAIEFLKQYHSEKKILARAASGTVLVAELDGRLVATGSLDGAEILALFVDPGHQGSGLGKQLMARLENRARESGATETLLSISLPSKQFYEGLGYVVAEKRVLDLGNGQMLTFWKASKHIVMRTSSSSAW